MLSLPPPTSDNMLVLKTHGGYGPPCLTDTAVPLLQRSKNDVKSTACLQPEGRLQRMSARAEGDAPPWCSQESLDVSHTLPTAQKGMHHGLPKHAMLSDELSTWPCSRCTCRAVVDTAYPVMPAWLARYESQHAATFWPAAPAAAQPAGRPCLTPAWCRPPNAPPSSPGVPLAVPPPPCPK